MWIKTVSIKKLINAFSRWSIPFILTGFFILVIAIIVAFLETYYSQRMEFGTNLMGLGIGVFSLGVAFLSVKMAHESNEKMEINANESFLKIHDLFEDKRILFLNQIRGNDFHLTEQMAWKCVTYFNRAFDLMKNSKIKEENRLLLFNQYIELLHQFPFQGKKIDKVEVRYNVVTLTDVKNLLNVYSDIRKNHLYDKKKDEPIKLFTPFLKDINSTESIDNLIDNFKKEVDETKIILKKIIGEQRRYPFMRLKQAKQLLKKNDN